MVKRLVFVILGIIIIPLLFTLCVSIFFYSNQEKIYQKVLVEINQAFEGRVIIDQIKIAPFKNFPYTSVDLKSIKFFESKDTTCQPLYTFNDLYVGFDLLAAWKGRYEIKMINLEGGAMNITKNHDGSFNILKAKNINESNDTTKSNFHFDLNKVQIKNVDIKYFDLLEDREVDLYCYNLLSKIRLRNAHYYLDLKSDFVTTVIDKKRTTFFNKKNIHTDIELDYDQSTHMLNVIPGKIYLNDAVFKIKGNIDIQNDMDLDINIKGDKPDFNIIAAFLPNDIGNALKSYKNEGKIFFDGNIKGKAINNHIPLVMVDFGCEQAYFLNKNVNKKVDQLRFTGRFTNGKFRNLKSSQLQINNFHARPEQGLFVGQLSIKNFVDPLIKLDVHADLDLEFLGKFFQLKTLDGVKGKILLDMDFDEIVDLNFGGASLAQLKEGINSELTMTNVEFDILDKNCKVTKANGHAIMREGAIIMDSLNFNINDNDFSLKGTLSDFPALLHKYDKDIKVSLEGKSKKMDIKEMISFLKPDNSAMDEVVEDLSFKIAFDSKPNDLLNFKYLPKGEFFIDQFYAKFKNYPHTFHDFHVDIVIGDYELKLKDLTGLIDNTDFHFTGKIDNYPKWFQADPKGDSNVEFYLDSKHLELNDLLTYNGQNYLPESYRDEVLQNAKIDGKMAMHYDKGFHSLDVYLNDFTAKMNLHPLKIKNFRGRVHYEDKHLVLENFSGIMGRSDFKVNMSYNFDSLKQNKQRPNYFDLTSNALDLDQLMNYGSEETSKNHNEAYNIFAIPFPNIDIKAKIQKLNYHKYWLQDVVSKIRVTKDHYIHIDTMSMKVADGGLQMKGYFNGSKSDDIYYHSTIYTQNLDIDKLLFKFDYLNSDQLINNTLHGKISGTIKSVFKMHPDFTPIVEKSKAHMDLTITDGSLVNFLPMQAMSKYFKDKNLNKIRFDTLTNVLEIDNGVINIPKMNINSSLGYMELSGRQKLDLSMEYFIRIPLKMVTKLSWRHLFGTSKNQVVDEDKEDDIIVRDESKKIRFLNVKLVGNPEDFKVSIGKPKDN